MMKKQPAEVFLLPEGRIVSEALFRPIEPEPPKGRRRRPGPAVYHVELAFDPSQLGEVKGRLTAACVAEWGAGADDDFCHGLILSPIGNGIIRAETIYNKFGQDGGGGVAVFGPSGRIEDEIMPSRKHEVCPGCWGIAAVTIAANLDARGRRYLSFYLSAFQKTRDQ